MMPKMVQGRSKHSSCPIGHRIYVFCGYEDGKLLNSIERMDTRKIATGDAFWLYIDVPHSVLSVRVEPVVSKLNDTEVVIMGGYR